MRLAPCLAALPLLLTLTACQPSSPAGDTAAGSGSSSSSTSEAEKTKELQKKAADLDRRAEELKTSTASDQEKIDAANQIEKERQELNKQSEGHN